MAKITGVGGVFFKVKDQDETHKWYKENMGLDIGPYGANFAWRDLESDAKKYTVWSTFKRDTDYFGNQEYMINYRVDNLEEMISELEKKGVSLVKPMETYEYGKFAWVEDPNGIRMELWEPIDDKLGIEE
ncbi:MAG: VOC family protein [Flavobacteriales bacterium]|nr:VOC family protein [Flavobacteriales bacterium]